LAIDKAARKMVRVGKASEKSRMLPLDPAPRRRAILLDQHPLWLDALERMLAEIGIQAVAKVSTSEEALSLITEEEPELFLLDIETGDSVSDGLACLRAACARVPTLRAVVVSVIDAPQLIDAAFAAGAAAYVLKRAHADDVALAVRQAFDCSLFLSNGRATGTSSAPTSDATSDLTARECEILALVAEGRTNHDVAKILWVTEQTVKFHLANIYRKLGVSNRTQASGWAHAHGLVTETSWGKSMPVTANARR
jgi:DNA-binding NarL/FixJ family response regulator